MPFQFKRKESVAKAVRRLCCGRIDTALECLKRGDHLEGVHAVRKEVKKIRAVLRLVREEIGKKTHRKNRDALRELAGRLSAMRDSHVRLNAFKGLVAHFKDRLPAKPFSEIKRALREQCRAEEEKFLHGNSLKAVEHDLRQLKRCFNGLKLESSGWDAIGPGLGRSYRRGLEMYATASRNPTSHNLHEWRKKVKDLLYQMQLLCPVSPKKLKPVMDRLETLGDLLGDDHDLVMLMEFVRRDVALRAQVRAFYELIRMRQEELQANALKWGGQFYSGSAEQFCGRLQGYWKEWRGGK